MTRVRAFHGTSRAAAAEIAVNGFRISRNVWDWLGDGAYFFQESRSRAQRWGQHLHGNEWAVIEALIDLQDCIDFLENEWFHLFVEVYDILLGKHKSSGLALPVQRQGRRGLDRLVVNTLAEELAASGRPVRSVRGVFEEGRPAYPGSGLYDQAHIQIAVRDLSVIEVVTTTTEVGPC